MPYCPECGTEVERSDRFCPNCGHGLAGTGEGSGETPAGAEREAGGGAAPTGTAGREPAAGTEPVAGAESTAGGQAGAPAASPEPEEPTNSRIDVPDDPFDLDVFEFSFKYPVARGWREIGIGGIVIVLSILLFPLIVFAGYDYRMGRAAAIGERRPPTWGDWIGLFVDGLRFVAVFIPLGVLGIAGFAGFIVAGLEPLAILWYFALILAAQGLMATYYGTGSLSKTYGNARFLRFLATVDFWLGFAYQIGVSFVLQIGFFVGAALLFITIVGIIPLLILLPVFFAYTYFVQAAIWGRIWHDAHEKGAVDTLGDTEDLSGSW